MPQRCAVLKGLDNWKARMQQKQKREQRRSDGKICRREGQRWWLGNLGLAVQRSELGFPFSSSLSLSLPSLSRLLCQDRMSMYLIYTFLPLSFLDLPAPAEVTALAASKTHPPSSESGRGGSLWTNWIRSLSHFFHPDLGDTDHSTKKITQKKKKEYQID